MPLPKHVTLLIHPDGSCALDAVNFTDATCTQATQEIMQALAGQAMGERFKPEAHRVPPQSVRQEAGR